MSEESSDTKLKRIESKIDQVLNHLALTPDPVVEPTPAPIPVVEPTPDPVVEPTPSPAPTSKKFYVQKGQLQEIAHKFDVTSNVQKMAEEPTGIWLGEWNQNVFDFVRTIVQDAESKQQIPVFITYNIPMRDLGGYSKGGAVDSGVYRQWISDVARGIGRESEAWIVFEPDAVPGFYAMNEADKQHRIQLIRESLQWIRNYAPKTKVYIDVGHPEWVSVDDVVKALNNFGIQDFDGFAINTSNRVSTEKCYEYGKQISERIGGKKFIIDTSRNGNPKSGSDWCNPSDEKVGARPNSLIGNRFPLLEANLWLKVPGESDGECGGGPSAGTIWQHKVIELARGVNW